MSKLINGRIPEGTECPFKEQCEFAQNKKCYHRGKDHKCDFSCATARAFDIIERNNKELSDNEIGYLIYLWEQKGYSFVPLKYDPDQDYTSYLNYYSDPEKNKQLIKQVLESNTNQ